MNLKAPGCKHYSDIAYDKIKFKPQPTLGRCGSLIALDSIGLPFGTFEINKPTGCSNPTKACVDTSLKSRIMWSDKYFKKGTVCDKPPQYEEQDSVRFRILKIVYF
jgi:hypothetical protein